jgi:hypothetical protein
MVSNGVLPLHSASECKHLEIVIFALLDMNALGVKYKDELCRSPLCDARDHGQSERILNLLKSLMEKTDDDLEKGISSSVPPIQSAAATSMSLKCPLMPSPLICFGQYLLFLTMAAANTPFFHSSISPLRTQHPLSNTTTFALPQSFSVKPIVLPPLLSYLEAGRSSGWSFPSTSSMVYITPGKTQQMK